LGGGLLVVLLILLVRVMQWPRWSLLVIMRAVRRALILLMVRLILVMIRAHVMRLHCVGIDDLRWGLRIPVPRSNWRVSGWSAHVIRWITWTTRAVEAVGVQSFRIRWHVLALGRGVVCGIE